MKTLLSFFAVSVVLLFSCSNADQTNTGNISEAQAIKLAEQFIKEQGYTADWPSTLTYENVQFTDDEKASTIEGVKTLRHNQLVATGVEARKYLKKSRWAVGFDYVNFEENIGRCVSMDTLGNDIKMHNGQLQMDWLTKDKVREVVK